MSRRLKRVVHHPENRRGTKENYLVLAEVAPDVIYNDYIRPICLPTENVEFKAGSNCWVVGWGNIQPSGSFPESDTMKQLKMTVLDANQCSCHFEEHDSPSNETAKRMICAGNQPGGGSACLDDSSMPLVCQDSTGSWLLAGLASSQAGCTETLCPSIYTRASPFAAWIQDTVSQEAQFVNAIDELFGESSIPKPRDTSPNTDLQSTRTTVGPLSIGTTFEPPKNWTTMSTQSISTVVETLSNNTTLETPSNSTTVERSSNSTTGNTMAGNSLDDMIEIVKKNTSQSSAASQTEWSLILYCCIGIFYLISASR